MFETDETDEMERTDFDSEEARVAYFHELGVRTARSIILDLEINACDDLSCAYQ